MSITVLAIGKKHESWVDEGITRYQTRLKKPFDLTWRLLPHSSRSENQAREEESARLTEAISTKDNPHVILLDERGKNLTSPGLAKHLQQQFDIGRSVTILIGGAYGVTDELRERADLVWSLSNLVFPHQLVRLVLTEQLYRAQEISAGRPYHHV